MWCRTVLVWVFKSNFHTTKKEKAVRTLLAPALIGSFVLTFVLAEGVSQEKQPDYKEMKKAMKQLAEEARVAAEEAKVQAEEVRKHAFCKWNHLSTDYASSPDSWLSKANSSLSRFELKWEKNSKRC